MDAARKFLRTAYPEPAERPRPVVLGPAPGTAATTAAATGTTPRTIDAVCERERDFATDIGRADDPNREWRRVTTAERQVTAELRTEAFMHAKMRNMHFRLATQAFIAGNGAVAKRHSELGKEHDRMMRNLNSSAAQQLIRIRNPHFCSFRGTNENVLDLHGLTVREGIDFLRGIFVNTKCTHGLPCAHFCAFYSVLFTHPCHPNTRHLPCTDRTFYVICGSGHHNKEHKTPLADAVRQFFHDCDFRFSDCSADQRGGMLRVRVPRNA